MNKLKKRPVMIFIGLSTVVISESTFRSNRYSYFMLNLDYFKCLIVRMYYIVMIKVEHSLKPQPHTHFPQTLTVSCPHLHLLLISPVFPPPPMARNCDSVGPRAPSMEHVEDAGIVPHPGWIKRVKFPLRLQIFGWNRERLLKNCL